MYLIKVQKWKYNGTLTKPHLQKPFVNFFKLVNIKYIRQIYI